MAHGKEQGTVIYACLVQGSERNVVMQLDDSSGTYKLPQIELAVADGCTDSLVQAICRSTGLTDMYDDSCVIHMCEEVAENDAMVALVIIDVINGMDQVEGAYRWMNATEAVEKVHSRGELSPFVQDLDSLFVGRDANQRFGAWCEREFLNDVKNAVTMELQKMQAITAHQRWQQMYYATRSIVFAIHTGTSSGKLFCKIMRQESNEATKTGTISEVLACDITGFLYTNGCLNVIVMTDFGETVHEWDQHGAVTASAADRQVVCREIHEKWSTIQQQSARHVQQLTDGGLPEYGRDWIKQQANRLWVFYKEEQLEGTLGADVQNICDRHIDEAFDLWNETNIPRTLVHGDMHVGNVSRTSSDIHFFDFESAYVGCPFMDLGNDYMLRKHEEWYLTQWTSYNDMGTLRKLASFMKTLGTLLSILVVKNDEQLPRTERNDYVEWHVHIYLSSLFCQSSS